MLRSSLINQQRNNIITYWIRVKGNQNIRVDDNFVPRIGETVLVVADTFYGQEEELKFRVVDVIYSVGRFGSPKETPLVVLNST